LAIANYIEMRSSVTSPFYKVRKYIEESLDKYLPSLGWATQYSRVSFSNMRYSEVIQKSQRQKLILTWVFRSAVLAGLYGGAAVLPYLLSRRSQRFLGRG
jgi:kynurenine 3-monooxygenase